MNIRRCLDILELECVTSPEALKRAYRNLVHIWHPDRFHGNSKLEKKAAGKLREINSAYNCLLAYFDPSQSKRLRMSIPDDLFCLSEDSNTENKISSRPQNDTGILNDIRERHSSKVAGLRASSARKTSSASKYVFFVFLFIILGLTGLVGYRLYDLDDIISISVGPASEVLEKLVIEKIGKDAARIEKPSFQNIVLEPGNEMMTTNAGGGYEIYLESGNIIITESWWRQDDMIMYKKYGGSMGIEKSQVKKIIKR